MYARMYTSIHFSIHPFTYDEIIISLYEPVHSWKTDKRRNEGKDERRKGKDKGKRIKKKNEN